MSKYNILVLITVIDEAYSHFEIITFVGIQIDRFLWISINKNDSILCLLINRWVYASLRKTPHWKKSINSLSTYLFIKSPQLHYNLIKVSTYVKKVISRNSFNNLPTISHVSKDCRNVFYKTQCIKYLNTYLSGKTSNIYLIKWAKRSLFKY